MDHRLTSLKFLTATGLIPVKVRPGQKDPFPEWDPRRVHLEDHALTLKSIQADPTLNLGGLFSGKYVDIDVDCAAASGPMKGRRNLVLEAALNHFLPPTPYVWGRKSKPQSHRVYALHDDFDRGPWSNVLRYVKNLKEGVIDGNSYSVEVRGGKPENGLFSVLPGSIHPSKEKVEWDKAIDPTVGGAYVSIEKLVRSIRLAVVASIIAPHWQSGVRNDLSLALAGTLWRIRTSTMAAFGLEPDEETPDGYYVLERADAEAIFEAVMKLSGDDDGDKRSRMLNLKNSWSKLDSEAGGKVTGGKVLAELIGPESGARVVKALYRLLSDNDSAEQIEALAERYVMWYGPGVIVDLDMVRGNRDTPWMTREQARNSLGGKNLMIGDKKIKVSDMLFGSSIINRVGGLTFDPSTPDLLVRDNGMTKVNQWRGFAVEPCEQQVKYEEIEPFHKYVTEIIADEHEDRAHWVFSWLADCLQFPHKKPGTALVLVGVEGAGKTFLGEHIMGRIIGPTHATQTNSVTTLTHNFNTIVDNKVFLCCNEAVHSYQKDVAARLKSIITDETIIIEPKGINSYTKPNHMHFMFTSNEEHAAIFISSSPYERRFTVLRVSSVRARDADYWNFMHMWVPTALPKIMRWLLDYKYQRWLVQRPIETDAKRNIQRVGVDTEVSWMLARLAAGFPITEFHHRHWFEAYNSDHVSLADQKNDRLIRSEWPDRVMSSVLEDDYRAYVRSLGKPVHTGSVVTSVRRVLPEGSLKVHSQTTVRYVDHKSGQTVQNRIRLHEFPDPDAIIKHLKSRYGAVVDEMMEEFKNLPMAELPMETQSDRGEV